MFSSRIEAKYFTGIPLDYDWVSEGSIIQDLVDYTHDWDKRFNGHDIERRGRILKDIRKREPPQDTQKFVHSLIKKQGVENIPWVYHEKA